MPIGSDIRVEYPWLSEPWAALSAYVQAARMPHALLIHGPAGTGKAVLAKSLAHRLLCAADDGEFACGRCAACRLLVADSHPDLLTIASPEASKGVKVEVVREMITALSLRPQYAHNRVVMLPSAHLMNRYAANTLLKTLEEPDLQTKFLLLAEDPNTIPPTIRSRCQRIPIRIPARTMTIAWLRNQSSSLSSDEIEARVTVARGAPLRAIALDVSSLQARRTALEAFVATSEGAADPVAVAAQWEKFGADELVPWLISWLEDLVRFRSASGAVVSNNPDLAERLCSLADSLNLRSLYACLELAYRAKRLLPGQINRSLLLEELAISCARMGFDGS